MKRHIFTAFLWLPALLVLPAACYAAADTDFVSRLVTEYYNKTPVTILPCSTTYVITQNYNANSITIIQRRLTPWGIMQVFLGYESGYGHNF